MSYDADLCNEKHENIKETLKAQDKTLTEHTERINKLEQRNEVLDTNLINVCSQLKSLTSTMRWFIGLIVGAFVGFFFYAIQVHLFK